MESAGAQSISESLAEFGTTPNDFARIFGAMNVGLVVQQADHSITACNAAAERILGLTADQIAGRTSHDPRWRAIREDGSPFVGDEHPAIVALKTGQPLRNIPMGVENPEGDLRWISINSDPILGPDGVATAVVTTFADVTEQRLAEEALRLSEGRYRAIVQNVSDIITVLNADGTWRFSSPSGSVLLGWPEGYDPEGGVFSLVHPDDLEVAGRAFAGVLEGTVPGAGPVVFRVRRADGEYLSLETTGLNLVDDPAINGVVLVSRDVTDRLRDQEELAAARDAALAALQAKQEFVAVVSHELRTPMHAVLGLSELLASSQLNDEQRLYVDSIRRSVQSLGNVVEDILDYTRADAGRLVLHPQPFALRSVLADVVTLFTPAASEKHLALAFTIDDGVPPTLMGDPDRIRQLITNLVGNAVKFTDAGSVTIAVGVVSSSETEVVVRIAVRDTGIGIAAERVDRLFEPFEQGEGATWRRHGGTGLGLAICRQLVELMGGEISVESTIGFGSEFTATVRLTAVAPERMTVRVSVPRRTTIARRRPRVLVVEDNEVNQLLVDRQLTTLEYEAVVVPDGLTALERLRQESFDAVLLDVQMPGLDGLDVARVFRSEEVGVDVRTPVIAMTASAMAGDRDACLAAGMDDYLAKPVGIDALRAMLDRWVRHREALPMVEPAAPGGTLDSLVAELGGDRATVMQMACTFLTELPQRHDAIMLAPDAAAFAAATHTLASAAAALSLTGLFNACRAAEQAAKHSQQFDRPTHERAIEAAVARSKPTLEAWVAAKQ